MHNFTRFLIHLRHSNAESEDGIARNVDVIFGVHAHVGDHQQIDGRDEDVGRIVDTFDLRGQSCSPSRHSLNQYGVSAFTACFERLDRL